MNLKSALLLILFSSMSNCCDKVHTFIPSSSIKRTEIEKGFFLDEKSPNEKVYMGEKFPVKYLNTEKIIPTGLDFDIYLNSLHRILRYASSKPNVTDVNRSLGLYYTKVILKRTIKDYGHRLQKQQREFIARMIEKAEYVLSHYIYNLRPYGWLDLEYRVSQLFIDDTFQIYAIKEFNKNELKHWILNKGKINEFVEAMDDTSLPKDKFAELAESIDQFYIGIRESDLCLSHIAYNPVPINLEEMRLCKRDHVCINHTHTSPSVAYSLSHRLLNIMMPQHIRGCYWKSPDEDNLHMNILCAFMYREAVYIARRGFFARDLFLEHIALCAFLGFEEFHRTSWFHKITTWINEYNCITESRNFVINSTQVYVHKYKNREKEKKLQKMKRARDEDLKSKCQMHPTALLSIVLAHAIRFTARYLHNTTDNEH